MSKIWIDIENTPHVLFFRPIIAGLKERGFEVAVTYRDYGGIRQLLADTHIPARAIGGDYGNGKVARVYGVLLRILRLYLFVRGRGFLVSVSHGSRTHIGASALAKIPSLTSYDYEFSSKFLVHRLATRVIIPECIPESFVAQLRVPRQKILRYHGFKEQIYLSEFKPSLESLPPEIAANRDKILVVLRPPATRSHYFTARSGVMFDSVLDLLGSTENIFVVVSARDPRQREEMENLALKSRRFLIIRKEVDGLNLIWNSDMVISGGGTMSREAALMGVPSYSIFGGTAGAVDRELERKGRLVVISRREELSRIRFAKRERVSGDILRAPVKEEILDAIISLCDNAGKSLK